MRPLQVITNSERSSFLGCRQRYAYAYLDRLRPVRTSAPLRLGTLVHTGIDQALRLVRQAQEAGLIKPGMNHDEWLTSRDAFLSLAKEEIDYKKEEYTREIRDSDLRESDQEDICKNVVIAKALVSEYLEHHWPFFRTQKVTHVEHSFDVPIRGTHSRYAGKVDSLWYDPTDRMHIIEEIKTTSNNPALWAEKAEIDTQTRGYAYSMLYNKIQAGGVLLRWVILKTKIPGPPKVLVKGAVSTDKRQHCTQALYQQALLDQVETRGVSITAEQHAFLETLPISTGCYHVVEHYITQEEVARWVEEVKINLKEMRQVRDDPRYRIRNMDFCTRSGGYCEYRAICVTERIASDHWVDAGIYRRASSSHEELEEQHTPEAIHESP